MHELGWGSPNYHARPDVIAMELSPASDLWMLAQTMVHIWTRQPASTNPSQLPGYMPLRKLLARCLSPSPSERPSANQVFQHAQAELAQLETDPDSMHNHIQTMNTTHDELTVACTALCNPIDAESPPDTEMLPLMHKMFSWLTQHAPGLGFWQHPASFQPDSMWSGLLWKSRELAAKLDWFLLDTDMCVRLVEEKTDKEKELWEKLEQDLLAGQMAVLRVIMQYWSAQCAQNKQFGVDTAFIASQVIKAVCPHSILPPPVGKNDGVLFKELVLAVQVLLGVQKPLPLLVRPMQCVQKDQPTESQPTNQQKQVVTASEGAGELDDIEKMLVDLEKRQEAATMKEEVAAVAVAHQVEEAVHEREETTTLEAELLSSLALTHPHLLPLLRAHTQSVPSTLGLPPSAPQNSTEKLPQEREQGGKLQQDKEQRGKLQREKEQGGKSQRGKEQGEMLVEEKTDKEKKLREVEQEINQDLSVLEGWDVAS